MAIKSGKLLDAEDATANAFHIFEWGNDSMWALQPIATSGGTAAYTIMGSNKPNASVEADFVEYRPTTATDVLIENAIDSGDFRFRYFAIKYTAGTATGTYDFWLEKKQDR